MSDKTDNGGREKDDPEILSPNKKKAQSKSGQSDDPRIIDGKAEEVNEAEAAKKDAPRAAALPLAPVIGAGVGGGLIGAVALGVFLHFSGALPLVGEESAEEARLAALETRIDAATDFARNETARLAERINEAEARTAALEPERVADLAAALEALEGGLSDLRQRLDANAKATGEAMTALRERTNELQAQADALRAQLPPAGLMEKVGANERRLGALETGVGALGPQVAALSAQMEVVSEKVDEPSGAEKAALGAVLASLTRAFEAGQPFLSDLQAITEITGPREDIAALEEIAATGVPSFETLKRRFDALVPQVLHAETTAGAEGYWDKLVANARTLITIRRQGEVEGEDAEAVLARMETRLDEKDLKGAVAAGQQLTGPAGDAAADWLASAQARLKGEALIADMNRLVMREIAAGDG